MTLRGVSKHKEGALFVRGTSAGEALWLVGVDREEYEAYEAHMMGKRHPAPLSGIYLWPVKEGFERAGIEPILPIPDSYTLDEVADEAVSWASPGPSSSETCMGAIVYFNKKLMALGQKNGGASYCLDQWFNGEKSDRYDGKMLLAAEAPIDPDADYSDAIELVEPLLPGDFDILRQRLPARIPLAEPRFRTPEDVREFRYALGDRGRLYEKK